MRGIVRWLLWPYRWYIQRRLPSALPRLAQAFRQTRHLEGTWGRYSDIDHHDSDSIE